MYITSAPISLTTLNEKSRPLYHDTLARCGIKRIFICCLNPIVTKNCAVYTHFDELAESIAYFKDKGYEVGVWIDGFGHGHPLSHETGGDNGLLDDFLEMEDINGPVPSTFCPLDDKLIQCYQNALKILATARPDIIMLDDDFRLNVRRDRTMACCCKLHLAEYQKQLGEPITRDDLKQRVFTGKGNRYRDMWLRVQGDSMLHFATKLREALDTVDPTVRLSTCACFDTWDYDGTDLLQIAKAFAGKTKPFIRTIGAPYHSEKIAKAVENTRLQSIWCKNNDIEPFAEGDLYPRPRFRVPSSPLELYDIALLATGANDGVLKYMFDYVQPFGYETGYTDRHIKNIESKKAIAELFADKTPTGVYVFEAMHKIKDWELSDQFDPQLLKNLERCAGTRAPRLLSENTIPTAYEPIDGMPMVVLGENARHVDLSLLKRGVLLDAVAARILKERGIDTGLLTSTPSSAVAEYDCAHEQTVYQIANVSLQSLECDAKAEILSRFLPDNKTASYRYQNADGMRFCVLGYDAYASADVTDPNFYFHNYYRHNQLPLLLEWLAQEKLPAVCTGNPFLYPIVSQSKDKKSLSVLLLNPFIDDALTPTVKLSKQYQSIRFVNCTGALNADTVTLSDIAPYGFAAFEVVE